MSKTHALVGLSPIKFVLAVVGVYAAVTTTALLVTRAGALAPPQCNIIDALPLVQESLIYTSAPKAQAKGEPTFDYVKRLRVFEDGRADYHARASAFVYDTCKQYVPARKD